MYKFALIGYPIKHSLSPWIHEQFLKRADLTGQYNIKEIPQTESFTEQMGILKKSPLNGFNITVPYKEKILPYLDEIDEEAKQIGAVNTVVAKDGHWKGYNTDGRGYVRTLEHSYETLKNNRQEKRLLMLGAGGAARGIYYALMKAGYTSIDIANRTIASAEKIKHLKFKKVNTNILSIDEAENMLDEYDVIIQTTSVGMKPNIEEMIVSLDRLKEKTIVSDIVYQPIETKFLKEAKRRGARIHHGHTMLIFQALYAFELWTGEVVTTDGMDEQLKEILEGESFANR